MTLASFMDSASDGLAYVLLAPFVLLIIASLPVLIVLAVIGRVMRPVMEAFWKAVA